MMPLTLIQLISEQTMQNLLPVLRLKPARLVHLATPRTVERSALVAERMERCGRFRDIRWSVQVGEKGGPELEEDLVALEGVQVVYVSCKRGGSGGRLLPLLDEINARARALGGTFTRRFLAVKQKPHGPVLANLQKRASELGIRLLFKQDLEKADPFA